MKKISLILCGLFLSLVAFNFINTDDKKVSSYFIDEEDYVDQFYGNKINDKWLTSEGVILDKSYSSMTFNPSSYEWGGHVLLADYKIEKSVTITYDIEETSIDGWFAISFGSPIRNSYFYDSQAAFIFTDSTTLYFNHDDSDNLKETDISYPFTPFDNCGTHQHIKVSLDRIDNETYSATLMICNTDDKILYEQKDVIFPNIDGYIGFNSNYCYLDLYSIKIENAFGEVEYYDDFSSSSCQFSTSGDSSCQWNAMTFSEDELPFGNKNTLFLSKLDSYITYETPYYKNEKIEFDHLFTLKSTFSLASADIGIETGLEIAKESFDKKGIFIGLRRKTIGYSLVSYDPTKKEETTISTNNMQPSLEVTLTVDVYSDGTLEIYTDDLNLSIKYDSIEGYFGLATRNNLNVSGIYGASVKDFSYSKTSYRDRTSEDIAINFNGTKSEVDGDDTYYDFYYNKDTWFTGENIKQSMYRTGYTDGYLNFSNSSPYSCFGPRIKYAEAIVRFDIEIVSSHPSNGACLGLQFAKSNIGTIYQNCPSLGLGYYPNPENPNEYVTSVFKTNCQIKDGYSNLILNDNGQPYNAFVAGNKYTFMYVIKDNTISMSFKNENEDEKVLMTPRTIVEVENTDGYICIYGANGLSFTLDNVSYINLDNNYSSSESNQLDGYISAIRKNFKKDNDLSDFILNQVTLTNGILKINDGGYLKTINKISNYILRTKLSNLSGTLSIKNSGDLAIELVNNKTKYISISDANHLYKIDLDNDFIFTNSYFEFMVFGDILTIKYTSGDKPVVSANRNIKEYKINTTSDFDNLILENSDGITALNNLSIFNLDSHTYIKTTDYNPETDETNPWVYRDNGIKKGCSGNVSKYAFTALSFLFVSSIIVSRAKRKEE